MAIIDIEVLDAFESFGDESAQSRLLIDKLCEEGFEASDIVETLYGLVDQGVFIVNTMGGVERA